MSKPSVVRRIEPEQGTLVSYSVGFGLSLLFTLLAFALAGLHWLHGRLLIAGLLALAVIQFMVQIMFFLHLGHESKPRWRQLLLGLMVFFVLILVIGSVWIMYNLNYRMAPAQINQYMSNQAASGL